MPFFVASSNSISLMVFIAIVYLPIGGLTIFHIILVARGRTTNEQVTGKFQGAMNPFSRGFFLNCLYILCGPRYPGYFSFHSTYTDFNWIFLRMQSSSISCRKRYFQHWTRFKYGAESVHGQYSAWCTKELLTKKWSMFSQFPSLDTLPNDFSPLLIFSLTI